jgi:hypothetical protein
LQAQLRHRPRRGEFSTSESVCTRPDTKRTPSSNEPEVTPVAMKIASVLTNSSSVIPTLQIFDACRFGARAFVVVADHEAPLELAADAFQRRRRQHAFRRAAGADIHVDAGFRVLVQLITPAMSPSPIRCTRAPTARNPFDDRRVTRAIEHANADLFDASRPWRAPARARSAGGLVEIDDAVS